MNQDTPQQDETTAQEQVADSPKQAEQEPEAQPQPDSEADKVQEMGQKLAEINDKYQRLYAEYENYRKRTTQEKADLILNGGKEVIKSILPVIDDFERALKHMADDATKEGVQLIYNKLIKTLEQKGLKPIEAIGNKFDENLHEAVTRIPVQAEEQKGTVIDEVEKGYYLNDKVLRYTKVVVGA